jgi:hydroxymethylbilane synthase
MQIRIGTRASKLALWQAEHIQTLLNQAGISSELVLIDTTGDKVLDRSLAKIGSKGLFTQELEDQLRSGEIDIAVHSAKDLPSALPPDLAIIAFGERELPGDVLVSRNKNLSLSDNQSFVVGTSSTRRVALLRYYYPHLTTAEMRGNLQTRIRKLDEGHADALLLAYAGVHRMGYDDMIIAHLPLDTFTPAVGQGSIAIEAGITIVPDKLNVVRQLTNHPDTETCLLAERGFLRRLEGGCSIPSFALARLLPSLTPNEPQQLTISGGLVSLTGTEIIRETLTGPAIEAAQIGQNLAEILLACGGDVLLQEIKTQLVSF